MPCRQSASGPAPASIACSLEIVLFLEIAQEPVMPLPPGPQRHRRRPPPAHHVAAVLHVAFEQRQRVLSVLDVGAHMLVEILDRLVREAVVLLQRQRCGAVCLGQLLLVAPPGGEAFGGALAAVKRHGAREAGYFRERLARHRSEEHTSELQSPCNLVCRLLLEKKKQTQDY